ncbi:MAG: hypothetical protein ACM65L_24720 [Microcoleus sp.]
MVERSRNYKSGFDYAQPTTFSRWLSVVETTNPASTTLSLRLFPGG